MWRMSSSSSTIRTLPPGRAGSGSPAARSRAAGPSVPTTGSVTTNEAPPPGATPAVIVPSCASTMPRQTARPMPVPPPAGLVVKNGSKIRLRTSSGMPGPLSCTVIRSWPWRRSCSAAMVELPRAAPADHRLLGVGDQVGQHLGQLIRIGHGLRQVRRQLLGDADAGALEAVAEQVERGIGQIWSMRTGTRVGACLRAMARKVLTILAQRSAAVRMLATAAATLDRGRHPRAWPRGPPRSRADC